MDNGGELDFFFRFFFKQVLCPVSVVLSAETSHNTRRLQPIQLRGKHGCGFWRCKSTMQSVWTHHMFRSDDS